jgi:osmotically-inducible protein OsmY
VLDDSLIKVTNSGPTIYLDGEVTSRNADEEAVGAAWSAPGVHEVIDRILITP